MGSVVRTQARGEVADHHSVAVYGRLVVSVWRENITLGSVQRVHEVVRSVCRSSEEVGVWMVLERSAQLPSVGVRRYLAFHMRTLRQRVGFYATSVEAEEEYGSLMRATFRSILLAGSGRAVRVGSSIEELAPWVAERVRPLTAHRCHGLVESTRRLPRRADAPVPLPEHAAGAGRCASASR